MWIRKTPAPGTPNYHLVAAAILSAAGLTDQARSESDWLIRNASALLHNLRSELALRVSRSQDIDRFIDSLRKAGLTISD
jgi:hypothetical protein